MKVHPACAAFPNMTDAEYVGLKTDIAANGLHEPIWTYKGFLIDGRHRLKACDELGIEARTQEWKSKGSLVSWIVSKNLHRRNLTASQRAAMATELLPIYEREAEQRKASRIQAAKTSENPNVFPKGPIGPVATSAQKAASDLEASERSVKRAKFIGAADPEKLAEVKAGTKSLHRAEAEIKQENAASEPPIDATGKPVTNEALHEAFRSEEFASIQSEIQRIRKRVATLCDTPLGVHLHAQSIDAHLKNAWSDLKFAAPYAPCCYCAAGRGQKTCKACHKVGWLPKLLYESAPPEMRK